LNEIDKFEFVGVILGADTIRPLRLAVISFRADNIRPYGFIVLLVICKHLDKPRFDKQIQKADLVSSLLFKNDFIISRQNTDYL
jgi:hypothetical protein